MNSAAFKLPADARRGPNCGVTALAVSTGVSFAKAWQTFQAVNPRTYGRRWKGGTYTRDQELALERLKVAYDNMQLPRMNLKNFVDTYAAPGTVYMVTTTTHVQTVLNGEVIDQAGKKPIDEFWGRKKFVRKVRIIKDAFKYSDTGSAAAPQPVKPQGHTSTARQLMLF